MDGLITMSKKEISKFLRFHTLDVCYTESSDEELTY
jgi:hypothetical protein